MMNSGSFVCICPPKSVELGADGHLHRGDSCRQLEAELREAVRGQGHESTAFVFSQLPGGGIASTARVSVSSEGDILSAISGELANYPYLVKKYCGEDEDCKHIAINGLNALDEARPISPATLVCRLYKRLGSGMLAKLRGTFALVCYDSHLVRVMTARDPSGSLDLVHGKTPSGSLVVASGGGVSLADCAVETIRPGHYKYGWYSDQVKYANDSDAVSREASEAAKAVARALAGIRKPTARSPAAAPAVRRPRQLSSASASREQAPGRQLPTSSARAKPFVPSAVARARAAKASAAQPRAPQVPHKPAPAQAAESPRPAAGADDSPPRSPSPDKLGAVPRHVLEALSGSLKEGSKQSRLLSSMLDTSSCALVITDARKEDHPIVYANRVFELETGYSQEEVLGRNCRFLQAPPSEARVPSYSSMALKSSVRKGQARHVRLINYHKDGSPMWNKLSIVPLRNRAGEVTHFIGMQKFAELGLDSASGKPSVSWCTTVPEAPASKMADQPGNDGLDSPSKKLSLPGRSTSCNDLMALHAMGSRSNSYGDLQALQV